MSERPTCGAAGSLGALRVSKSTREEAGSCNFCRRPHRVVLVVTGEGLLVRFCRRCFSELVREGRQL